MKSRIIPNENPTPFRFNREQLRHMKKTPSFPTLRIDEEKLEEIGMTKEELLNNLKTEGNTEILKKESLETKGDTEILLNDLRKEEDIHKETSTISDT